MVLTAPANAVRRPDGPDLTAGPAETPTGVIVEEQPLANAGGPAWQETRTDAPGNDEGMRGVSKRIGNLKFISRVQTMLLIAHIACQFGHLFTQS